MVVIKVHPTACLVPMKSLVLLYFGAARLLCKSIVGLIPSLIGIPIFAAMLFIHLFCGA
jgi:hypothetical protein